MSRTVEGNHTLAGTCGIAVMAKASIPGRAKTRLVPPLTFTEASDFNTAFLRDVADNIGAAAREAPINGYVAFGPPDPVGFFSSMLPPSIGLIDAWHANFGDCLFTAIAQLFARGHAAAVVLNSDSPTLPTSFLIETAQRLAHPGDRAILGPSSDGGYYLLGLKAPHRRLFEQVAWSTELVAAQTLERAAEIGLDVEVLPEWYDVDDACSLRMLCAEFDEVVPAPSERRRYTALHSARLMRTLMATSDLRSRIETVSGPSIQRAAE
jgi:rSAM/selenodomain-associated transferase 1